jgi:hypothetical protein
MMVTRQEGEGEEEQGWGKYEYSNCNGDVERLVRRSFFAMSAATATGGAGLGCMMYGSINSSTNG